MTTNAIMLGSLYSRINIISHHYDKRQNNFLFYDLYIAIMAQFLSLLNGVHQINHPWTYWDNSSIPYKKEIYRWDKWALNLFTLHLFIMSFFQIYRSTVLIETDFYNIWLYGHQWMKQLKTSTERNCLLVANEIILIIQNKFDRMM